MVDYTISITNKCNLNCSYCYEKHLHTAFGCISPEMMKQVTDYINRRRDAGTVYLFGGEPLLYKDKVTYFCEHLHAKEIVITTNGTLLDEPFIKWCAEKGVIINMSHDGADCSERGVNRDLLDANLKLLLQYQPDTLVQLVYTEKTLPHLYEQVMHLKNLGVKKVSAAMNAFLVPEDPDSFGELLREQWHQISKIPHLFLYELAVKIKSIRTHTPSTCALCKKKLFINWDGQFYPCMQFQNIPEFRCGSIAAGIEAEKARKAHPDYGMRAERCEGCEIAEYCRNSCACKKMATTGTLRNISDAACLEEQVHILTALEMLKKGGIQS